MARSLAIIFAGSGEFGKPALHALIERGHQIVQVYTQPDRPAGRGRNLTPTPIAAAAQPWKLPLIRTADLNTEPLPPADLLIVIAFGQKISPAAADHPRLGSLNLHASLLPKYRGAAPINWAIINGEKFTGNSIIRLAQKMDAGNILAQSQIPIGESETAGELHDLLAQDGAGLIVRTVNDLADARAVENSQDESLATAAPKISREMAVLDWRRPARELAALINGLSPWPGCQVRLIDHSSGEIARATILRAAPQVGQVGRASPIGCITADGTIAVSDGTVRILELQPPAKRPMPLDAYARGHRWSAGLRLESIPPPKP